MTTQFVTADAYRWMANFAVLIDANYDRLTALDSRIGDADHGANMARGAVAIRDVLSDQASLTPHELLHAIGEAVLEGIGGAAGPLYASLILGMANTGIDRDALTVTELAASVEAGVAALARRGSTELNDKTMYDAVAPSARAMLDAAADGADLMSTARAAEQASLDGLAATEALQARKGRASYLGPRSVGHLDPGAASVTLLFTALADAVA